MTMFQSIKGAFSFACEVMRVRNPNQLYGTTLLRTYGSGPVPTSFSLRVETKTKGDLSTRPKQHN